MNPEGPVIVSRSFCCSITPDDLRGLSAAKRASIMATLKGMALPEFIEQFAEWSTGPEAATLRRHRHAQARCRAFRMIRGGRPDESRLKR